MLSRLRRGLVRTRADLGMSMTEFRIICCVFLLSSLFPIIASIGRRAGSLELLRTSTSQSLLALGAILLPLWLLLSILFAIVGTVRRSVSEPGSSVPNFE